ncbi:MAG: hypothetical protein PVG79_08900 [Gemmatimonadales bacterium]|jgi:hypothetical protein
MRCVPKAGMVFEIKARGDGDTGKSSLIYDRKAGPPVEYDLD